MRQTNNQSPAGNYYDKYSSSNPVARLLMRGFFRSFDAFLDEANPSTALDAGCGEGHLSLRMARRGITVSACDISASCVAATRSLLQSAGCAGSIFEADVCNVKACPAPDLVVCCEVLEHLPDPKAALDTLAGIGARSFIFSVPKEPLWRILNLARGAYVKDMGNTPGHIQHWNSNTFIRLVESKFKIVAVRHPLPWTMILAKEKGKP
ncbi:MAG: methyltransferase domain-containing protein [Elusimicrobiales bacterium]